MREHDDPKNWMPFQFTTEEGGNVDPHEIAQVRREMLPKMFAQEYLASFETMANRVYYAFEEDSNMPFNERRGR